MQLIFENCGILDENPAPNKYEYEKHKSIGPSFSMGKRFDLPESEYCLEISKINLLCIYIHIYTCSDRHCIRYLLTCTCIQMSCALKVRFLV